VNVWQRSIHIRLQTKRKGERCVEKEYEHQAMVGCDSGEFLQKERMESSKQQAIESTEALLGYVEKEC
jgi:hypothetical protein